MSGAAHGGGGQQRRARRAPGDQLHQAAAIIPPPGLFHGRGNRLVAGQLAVPLGDCRRPPDQRVEPVSRQHKAAQRAPDVVSVAVVGGFVGQHEFQPVGALQRRRVQIDGRMKQAVQAGAGQVLAEVDRPPAGGRRVDFQQATGPAQPQRKPQVCPEQRPAGEQHARRPDQGQQHRRVQRPFRVLWGECSGIRTAGKARLGAAGFGGLGKGSFRGGIGFILHNRIHRGGQRLAPLRLCRSHQADLRGIGQSVQHAGPALGQAHRQQQPQQHKAPQGVLHPAADAPGQQRPRRQHGQNQQAGGNQQFHLVPLFLSAAPQPSRKMARHCLYSNSTDRVVFHRVLVAFSR